MHELAASFISFISVLAIVMSMLVVVSKAGPPDDRSGYA